MALDSLTGGRKISDMEKVSSISSLSDLKKVLIPLMDGNESLSKNKSKSLTLDALKTAIESELTTYVNISCSDFTDLYNNGGLIPGVNYCLSDFVSYMWVPGPLAGDDDEHANLTNVDILGTYYVGIHPVLPATTAYEYGTGYLKEFPYIEVEWHPITEDTVYYGYGRMPEKANEYGVITRMKHKPRNLETEFDFINAVVRASSMGGVYIGASRSAPLNPNQVSGLVGFFKTQGNYFKIPKAEYKYIGSTAGEGLNLFHNVFFSGTDGGPTRVQELHPIIHRIEGSSRFTVIPNRLYNNYDDSVGSYYSTSACNYFYYLYRTWMMGIYNSIGNAYSEEVRNIYIGRTPVTPGNKCPWQISNVPVVILSKPFLTEQTTSDLNKVGPVKVYELADYYIHRNITIKNSDMIYIKRYSESGSSRRIPVDSTVNINSSFGLNILTHSEEINFDHCYFSCFINIYNSSVTRSAYLSILDLDSSVISNAYDLKLSNVLDSTISRVAYITQLFNDSVIKNSELRDIYSLNFITEENHVYEDTCSILDNVVDSKFYLTGGLNNNESFITPYGVPQFNNCEIGLVGDIAFCIGSNYTSNPVFNTEVLVKPDDLASLATPTNNFDMTSYPWIIQGLKFHSDGCNGVLVTASNNSNKSLSSTNPYIFLPDRNLDILYNSQESKIIRKYGGYYHNSQYLVNVLNQ